MFSHVIHINLFRSYILTSQQSSAISFGEIKQLLVSSWYVHLYSTASFQWLLTTYVYMTLSSNRTHRTHNVVSSAHLLCLDVNPNLLFYFKIHSRILLINQCSRSSCNWQPDVISRFFVVAYEIRFKFVDRVEFGVLYIVYDQSNNFLFRIHCIFAFNTSSIFFIIICRFPFSPAHQLWGTPWSY